MAPEADLQVIDEGGQRQGPSTQGIPKAGSPRPKHRTTISRTRHGVNRSLTAAVSPAPAVRKTSPQGVEIDDTTKHARAWAKIFKKPDWLKAAVRCGAYPVLVGHNVRQLYEDSTSGSVYIFLLDLDWCGELPYERVKIMECLQDYDFDPDRHTIQIRGTNITVNICNTLNQCRAFDCRDHSWFTDVNQLVSKEDMETAVLYYNVGPQSPEVLLVKLPSPLPSYYGIRIKFKHCPNPSDSDPLEWVFIPAQNGEDKMHASSFDYDRVPRSRLKTITWVRDSSVGRS